MAAQPCAAANADAGPRRTWGVGRGRFPLFPGCILYAGEARILSVTREWATAMRGRGDIPFEVHGGGRFLLPAREYVPAYVRTYEEGLLRVKVEEALEALRCCTLCPRTCRVNRLENRFAVCKVGRYARVSAAFHHFGEEDVLRGWRGSGTIFFAWCNLRCQFCLHPDTRVFTDRGARRIEEVFASAPPGVVVGGGIVRPVSGERVLTRTGRMAPVAKAFCHPYRGEMVVITPAGPPRPGGHPGPLALRGLTTVRSRGEGARPPGDDFARPRGRRERRPPGGPSRRPERGGRWDRPGLS